MKKLILTFLSLFCLLGANNAQQKTVARIDQMPDKPSPYLMRDWKKVTKDYDNFVFDISKTGTYLPLSRISGNAGVNYPSVNNIKMKTFVGQDNTDIGEAINILPAIIGASLVGVDKTNHFSINWVGKAKDFFNSANGQNVYLNNYSAGTGGDWWYETMPNIYFYQLYSLYPNGAGEFASQFTTVADRQLNVVYKLGGKLYPWEAPNMNYRAFNLLTEEPTSSGVKQPEAAGAISWILYQAYLETGDIKYRRGAELALDFLQNWTSNPSYEIQLPYGILAAARLNAEEGTEYDIDKFVNWVFSNATGTLRQWGTIAGQWNGYDMAGLVGEAKDNGDDYAFLMNGFQHAAALAPVVKYDKRYAKAFGKWLLNLANASRFFYANGLPEANQEAASLAWAKTNDPNFCIPFEAIKEKWQGTSPMAMGDAVKGGWAPTNLSLYSGSSVGYLGSLIEPTNVEGILQIDLNKTDFRGENTYPNYLYYNPNSTSENVNVSLSAGNFDIYDAITHSVIASNVSGSTTISVPSKDVRLLVIYPAGSATSQKGRQLVVTGGGIIDYHYNYNYSPSFRIKSFHADKTSVTSGEVVTFNTLTQNGTSVSYKWYANNSVISGQTTSSLNWTAPASAGIYTIKCEATSGSETVSTENVSITVAEAGTVAPNIEEINFNGQSPFDQSAVVEVSVNANTTAGTISWTTSAGTLANANTVTPTWTLPSTPGVYSITLTITNGLGSSTKDRKILVKDLSDQNENFSPVVYYPFDGNTNNDAQDAYHAVSVNAVKTSDPEGHSNRAYEFTSSSQYIYTPNDAALNFGDKLAVSFWVRPENIGSGEQFVLSHGSWEERYKFSLTPEKKMRITIKTSDRTVDMDDPKELQNGVYAHYVGVFTGYSLEIYRDGELAAFTDLGGTVNPSTKSITYGRKDETISDYTFKGAIDEVRIYNNELNPHFITKLPTIFNEVQEANLDVKALTIGGNDWTDKLDETYQVACGNTDSQLQINIEANDGANVDKSSINVDVSKPSVQTIDFKITSNDGIASKNYSLTIEKRFIFNSIVSQKWNKVLTVNNNTETNGGFKFEAYEWFKDGAKIGTNKQYYSVGNKTTDQLDANAEYAVKVTTVGGQTLQTCPGKVVLKNSSMLLYPNPAILGEAVYLEADVEAEELAGAEVRIYNLSGYHVKTIPVSEKKTQIVLPSSGNYIMKLVSPSGLQGEFKMVVR